MAFGDNGQFFTTLDDALAKEYDMEGRKVFNRLGDTSRWSEFRGQVFKGKAFVFHALTKLSAGGRMDTLTNVRDTEWPIALDMAYTPLAITAADIRGIRHTMKVNNVDQVQTEDLKFACAKLAVELADEMDQDRAMKMNMALWQSANCQMATIHTMYDADGTTFTGAAGTAAAFMRIKSGSIAQFVPGDVLDIYSSTDGTTKRATVRVLDVIASSQGPAIAGAARVADIGPGLIVQNCSANGTVGVVTWNAVATPDADDYIARSGEFSTSTLRNILGFPSWFDPTVNVYRDESGNAIDRDQAGSQWQLPEDVAIAAAGSETTLDLVQHLKKLSDFLPYRVKTGRMKRKGVTGGPELPDSMTMFGPVDLINKAVENGNDVQFTQSTSPTLSEAQRKMYQRLGFDGTVYTSPTLGKIAFQADLACPPFQLYLLSPDSFFYVSFNGKPGSVSWVMNGNSRWHPIVGDSLKTPTSWQQAANWTALCLSCDQPAANARITGVKAAA